MVGNAQQWSNLCDDDCGLWVGAAGSAWVTVMGLTGDCNGTGGLGGGGCCYGAARFLVPCAVRSAEKRIRHGAAASCGRLCNAGPARGRVSGSQGKGAAVGMQLHPRGRCRKVLSDMRLQAQAEHSTIRSGLRYPLSLNDVTGDQEAQPRQAAVPAADVSGACSSH